MSNTINKLTSVKVIREADELCEQVPFTYQMTDGEVEWFWYVSAKYCIADWVQDNSDEDFILTIDDDSIVTMSKALDDDAMSPKAVMLSDDSALQHIFFYLYNGDS